MDENKGKAAMSSHFSTLVLLTSSGLNSLMIDCKLEKLIFFQKYQNTGGLNTTVTPEMPIKTALPKTSGFLPSIVDHFYDVTSC